MGTAPYPADYDEAMRRFMGTRMPDGAHNVWRDTYRSLVDQGLDETSIQLAERALIAERARSEMFLARLVTVGGLTPEEAVARGADLATVARVVGDLALPDGADVRVGDDRLDFR